MTLRYEIPVVSAADHVLYEGLPRLQPVLDQLGAGAVLIGGLATAAWLTSRPVGFPVRATRDVDLGIDRLAVGVRRDRAVIRPLLVEHDFVGGVHGEPFRFGYATNDGTFVVDLLMAKGSSRDQPPTLEPGLASLAAPGLRYALDRGPVPLELTLAGDEMRTFQMHTVTLDAAFVMKAALVAENTRPQAGRRVTDTADALMLAGACAADADAMLALASARRRSEPKKAITWLRSVDSPGSMAARRLAEHVGDASAAVWAVEASRRFVVALEAA